MIVLVVICDIGYTFFAASKQVCWGSYSRLNLLAAMEWC